MARSPLFLARRGYRQKRMMDAGRILPVLGGVLFMLPIFWGAPGVGHAGTAFGGIYIFAVWFGLIVMAFFLSRRLAPLVGDAPARDAGGEDENDLL